MLEGYEMEKMDKAKTALGEKIRSARKNAGLTQAQLAEKLFVSRQAITKWEAGKGMPDLENLRQLSSLLHISIDSLLDGGQAIDLSVTRARIDLDDYTYTRSIKGRWNKKAGKKDMARRVKVIDALAGADANDFYIKMLEKAQKDVRMELINALRHEPGNVSLLMDMSKTEKGKNKDKVFELLAEREDVCVHEYFRELAKKKPETVLKHLRDTTADWASELVADICGRVIEQFDKADSPTDTEKQDLSDIIQNVVR